MISKYTWPNFRGGSEKDGCRVLIDEQGFTDDVKYGTTKIFIQSPQTISQLEYARLELIPGIVVFLQKVIFFITQELLCKMLCPFPSPPPFRRLQYTNCK